MILYDAMVDGQARKGLAVVTTYGYIYMLDRGTGEPI